MSSIATARRALANIFKLILRPHFVTRSGGSTPYKLHRSSLIWLSPNPDTSQLTNDFAHRKRHLAPAPHKCEEPGYAADNPPIRRLDWEHQHSESRKDQPNNGPQKLNPAPSGVATQCEQ